MPVRAAATVVLLRDAQPGRDGVEVWLLTRSAGMVFAAGMTVFPGGRVEVGDADLPWAGKPPQQPDLVGAAVRETFEETGVLLGVPGLDGRADLGAGAEPSSELRSGTSSELRAARADVEAGRTSFGALLREHGIAIDPSGLLPWARWVTPEGESRRYDTMFFVTALPDGQTPAAVTGEAVRAGWAAPAEALAQHDRRERRMLPPTMITLRSIASFGTVAEVLAAAPGRSLDPVRPTLSDRVVTLPSGERFEI